MDLFNQCQQSFWAYEHIQQIPLLSIFIDPPLAVSFKCLESRGMNASKVVESVFDLVCSCQTTPASGVSPEEQMSAFQSKKHASVS